MKERCIHAKGIGNAEEHWDFCKLNEHPSGRMSLCVLIGGNTCENFETEENLELKEVECKKSVSKNLGYKKG